jgi:hypothetical protein
MRDGKEWPMDLVFLLAISCSVLVLITFAEFSKKKIAFRDFLGLTKSTEVLGQDRGQ